MYIRSEIRRHRSLASFVAVVSLLASLAGPARAGLITGTFEDQNPGPNAFKNDFRPTNGFNTGGFLLNNSYNATFGSWSGFSTSSKVDNVFGGLDYTHQYGAYAPTAAGNTGSGGSATYGVAFGSERGDSVINLPAGSTPVSMDVTNTTYVAQSITLGDSFARAFRQGDFFRLDILGFTGLGGTGTQVGDLPFYLADFRGTSLILVRDWTTVNLGALAGSSSLTFTLTSTDVGNFGINTPTYFAVDNLVALTPVPEPTAAVLSGLGLGVVGLVYRRKARA